MTVRRIHHPHLLHCLEHPRVFNSDTNYDHPRGCHRLLLLPHNSSHQPPTQHIPPISSQPPMPAQPKPVPSLHLPSTPDRCPVAHEPFGREDGERQIRWAGVENLKNQVGGSGKAGGRTRNCSMVAPDITSAACGSHMTDAPSVCPATATSMSARPAPSASVLLHSGCREDCSHEKRPRQGRGRGSGEAAHGKAITLVGHSMEQLLHGAGSCSRATLRLSASSHRTRAMHRSRAPLRPVAQLPARSSHTPAAALPRARNPYPSRQLPCNTLTVLHLALMIRKDQ